MRLSKEEASEYGKRGGKRGSELMTHCIEGDYVNVRAISLRLGVSVDTVKRRMRQLKAAAGPITWAALGKRA